MNVLVFGYYNHKNLGDELFIDAFQTIFPSINFTFVDHISKENLENVDAVFFGGGSFLDGDPSIGKDAIDTLCDKKIFYIGVGVETNIHPFHIELMKRAELIATRSKNFDNIKNLNKNIIYTPDLVYVLTSKVSKKKKKKSILYLPNINTVPRSSDPYWKHLYWERFKHEFSQVLDELVSSEYNIDMFSMCTGPEENDDWAAVEICNRMLRRKSHLISCKKDYIKFFSSYELVITQRYHGIVLSELAQTPYISIAHHDKLKQSAFDIGSFISYFEFSKENIFNKIFNKNKSDGSNLPIVNNIFIELREKVLKILSG